MKRSLVVAVTLNSFEITHKDTSGWLKKQHQSTRSHIKVHVSCHVTLNFGGFSFFRFLRFFFHDPRKNTRAQEPKNFLRK